MAEVGIEVPNQFAAAFVGGSAASKMQEPIRPTVSGSAILIYPVTSYSSISIVKTWQRGGSRILRNPSRILKKTDSGPGRVQ